MDNIRERDFFRYLSKGNGRECEAKLTTLFRFAYYLGWREFVRIQVQLLPFENEDDTRRAAELLNDVTWVLASEKLDKVLASEKPDETWAMLWGDEQRCIGELMTEQPSGVSSIVRGYAAFYRDYADIFAPWMERFASDLFSLAAVESDRPSVESDRPSVESDRPAVKSDRLKLLQWALYGLVRRLDEGCVYTGGWMDRSAEDIRKLTTRGKVTRDKIKSKHLEQLINHLALIKPSTSSD